MKEALHFGLLITIVVFAFIAAASAREAANTKPILVREFIVIVDTGTDAEAIVKVLGDIIKVD